MVTALTALYRGLAQNALDRSFPLNALDRGPALKATARNKQGVRYEGCRTSTGLRMLYMHTQLQLLSCPEPETMDADRAGGARASPRHSKRFPLLPSPTSTSPSPLPPRRPPYLALPSAALNGKPHACNPPPPPATEAMDADGASARASARQGSYAPLSYPLLRRLPPRAKAPGPSGIDKARAGVRSGS